MVAPISPPPLLGGNADRLAALRNSWQRDADGAFEFNHLFPLILDAASDDFLVADFSRAITAGPSIKARKMLLDTKTHEMNEEHREALQVKLAALFGRGPETPEVGTTPQP